MNLFKRIFSKKEKRATLHMTLQDAKRIFPECRYAVCDVKTKLPIWLCDSLSEAKYVCESTFWFGGCLCFVYDMQMDCNL